MNKVVEWETHFLRDDQAAGLSLHPRYSLFRKEPYVRVAIFSMDFDRARDYAWLMISANGDVDLYDKLKKAYERGRRSVTGVL